MWKSEKLKLSLLWKSEKYKLFFIHVKDWKDWKYLSSQIFSIASLKIFTIANSARSSFCYDVPLLCQFCVTFGPLLCHFWSNIAPILANAESLLDFHLGRVFAPTPRRLSYLSKDYRFPYQPVELFYYCILNLKFEYSIATYIKYTTKGLDKMQLHINIASLHLETLQNTFKED